MHCLHGKAVLKKQEIEDLTCGTTCGFIQLMLSVLKGFCQNIFSFFEGSAIQGSPLPKTFAFEGPTVLH